jgi:ubiquinone/menaquinone biosynthesis C-methylase UbiE
MIDLAAIGPGQRVLDVATGVGEPALSAARRSGPTARVDAIDSSAAMLDLARARAAELNLENVMFREMAAENLAYPEASFDAVLCRWGLMFLENLQETLAGFRRILVPGGRLVAVVWGPPGAACQRGHDRLRPLQRSDTA